MPILRERSDLLARPDDFLFSSPPRITSFCVFLRSSVHCSTSSVSDFSANLCLDTRCAKVHDFLITSSVLFDSLVLFSFFYLVNIAFLLVYFILLSRFCVVTLMQ